MEGNNMERYADVKRFAEDRNELVFVFTVDLESRNTVGARFAVSAEMLKRCEPRVRQMSISDVVERQLMKMCNSVTSFDAIGKVGDRFRCNVLQIFGLPVATEVEGQIGEGTTADSFAKELAAIATKQLTEWYEANKEDL